MEIYTLTTVWGSRNNRITSSSYFTSIDSAEQHVNLLISVGNSKTEIDGSSELIPLNIDIHNFEKGWVEKNSNEKEVRIYIAHKFQQSVMETYDVG